MRIKLPIFFFNDETEKLSDLEINYDLRKSDIREVIFFNIDAIAPCENCGKTYSQIYTSGDVFICQKTIIEVERLMTGYLVNSN